MKNGTLLSIFRVRFKSAEKAYAPYTAMYHLFTKGKSTVLFQPFTSVREKPHRPGLWVDYKHHIETPEDVASYFGVKLEAAEKILAASAEYCDASRGVKIIESEDMLNYINGELRRHRLPQYVSMEDLEGYTLQWWREKENG